MDFIAVFPEGAKMLVQVCADLSAPDTCKRELRALQAAMKESGLEQGPVITEGSTPETIRTDAGEIRIVPAADFLSVEPV